MKTFKTISQALTYLTLNGKPPSNIFNIVLELTEKGITKVNKEYIFIDEFNILG